MKTKHLLFAAALPLAFAACTNEEFDSQNNSPELSSEQRPLVEVKLDFQKGDADTRVSYNGTGYGWEATDKIGAFLMDEIASNYRPFGTTAKAWEKETWYEHYKLVDYIHTDYPFSWNASTSAWEAPSKLQEGNYFFAAPYETYEGQRQLIHRIDGQVQTGGTQEAMNKAIAQNQYFIGYAQVKAGAENKEALKSVIMTPVLAPVKVTLKNIGTEAKDIEKIVIRGNQVATSLTIDPTNASYGGTDENGSIKEGTKYNLHGDREDANAEKGVFNYANLIGAEEDVYVRGTNEVLVHNVASGATDYKQGDALRQLVQAVYSVEEKAETGDVPAVTIPQYEKQAVLTFAKPVHVASKSEINFAVMVNAIPSVNKSSAALLADDDPANNGSAVEGQGLFMDIIATQGRITSIDLTKINERENAGSTSQLKENTVLTNIAIASLKPSTKNELIVQFDDNSVVKESMMDVEASTELLAFINWNAQNARLNTVNLLRDVAFTKEMYDAIKADSYKGQLAVQSKDNNGKLLVENDVPVDVLNLLDKTTTAVVVLDGERTMPRSVAEGLKDAELTIENQGTLAIGKEEVVVYKSLVNYGTVKVAKDGSLKGTATNNITNYGLIKNEGSIYNVKNEVKEVGNDEYKGYIETSAQTNHIVSNAEKATIELMEATHKIEGLSNNGGIIYLNTDAGVTASTLKSQNVNKLKVTKGVIDLNNMDNETVKELIIDGEVSVEGWNNATPRVSTYHEFKIVEKASISGTVKFVNAGVLGTSKVTVKSGSLTMDKTVKFCDITFIKGVAVAVATKGEVSANNVTWNANNVSNLGSFTCKSSTGNYTITDGKDVEVEKVESDKERDFKDALEKAFDKFVSTEQINKADKYNLNGTEEITWGSDKIVGTKAFFGYWVEHTGEKEGTDAVIAYKAYLEENKDAKITDTYDSMVEQFMETETSENFEEVVKALTWEEPTSGAWSERIYADKKGTDGKPITAVKQAEDAFKAAVIEGKVMNGNKNLTEKEKVVLCNSAKNYAPAKDQVLVSDNIYKIFTNVAIGLTDDWKTNAKFSAKYTLNSDSWTLARVKSWIGEVITTDVDNVYVRDAKKFLTDDVVKESETWKYNDALIKAIVVKVKESVN